MKSAAYVLINVAIIELILVAGFKGEILVDPIHGVEWFSCADCPTESFDQALGWESERGPIRPSDLDLKTCASAFGDSFTYGDEVEDDQTWEYAASAALNCKIENFGVGGYGLDQSYLKYKKFSPDTEIVILNVYEEMMRRNGAASWRFYAKRPDTLPKPYFHLAGDQMTLVPPPQSLTGEAIERHHKHDTYWPAFKVGFPYVLTFPRSVYRQGKLKFTDRAKIWSTQDQVDLARAIINQAVNAIQTNGSIPVVQFLPKPENISANARPYAAFKEALIDSLPTLCVIDPFDALVKNGEPYDSLRAPKGHFSARGNEMIAQNLADGLQNVCGLLGRPDVS